MGKFDWERFESSWVKRFTTLRGPRSSSVLLMERLWKPSPWLFWLWMPWNMSLLGPSPLKSFGSHLPVPWHLLIFRKWYKSPGEIEEEGGKEKWCSEQSCMEVAAALSSLEDLSASPFGSATLSALARQPGKHSHIPPLSSKGLLCCISGHVFCSQV